jgi:hypothetical protein
LHYETDDAFIEEQYMRRLGCLFAIGMMWLCIVDCFSQGLLFYGNEKRISERATYSVLREGHERTFTNAFRISFDYLVRNVESPGYILYLEDRDAGKTYSFTYLHKPGDRCSFSFNEDGKRIFCTFELDKEDYDHRWLPVSIALDIPTDCARITIGKRSKEISNLGLEPTGFSPHIYFGKCEYILDVASYAIRNLSLTDGEEIMIFPLNESSGEDVHDSRGHVVGQVTNPVWLINQSYYWKELFTDYSSTPSGLNFDKTHQNILFFNQDSLSAFDLYTHELSKTPYKTPLPVQLRLGMNFLDEASRELYTYEVADSHGDAMVAALDLTTKEWRPASSDYLCQQLHHHCGFFHPGERKFFLFGGYGSRRYSNTFLAYDLNTCRWDTLAFSGDRVIPRYFSGMAVSNDYKRVYLYGGMGNEAGDQNVGRNYLYDLYRIDMQTRSVQKLWEAKAPAVNRVVPRNMILSADEKHLFLLGYPEYLPNSTLQLYRLSVRDGECEAVGDSIPIVSEEIATNANLYFNEELNEFYCSVQEFEKHGQVTTRLYSLSAPPVTLDDVEYYSRRRNALNAGLLGAVVGGVLLLAACVWGIMHHKRKRDRMSAETASAGVRPEEVSDISEVPAVESPEVKEEEVEKEPSEWEELPAVLPPDKNAIFLFGMFTILDNAGRDITYMLSPKLRTIFLYILLNSVGKRGVLSSDMNQIFWPDKSGSNVKNLKGVSMNHVRKILQDVDGIELVYRNGYFCMVFGEEFYCDYIRLMNLTSPEKKKKETPGAIRAEWLEILLRGKFIPAAESDLFDYYKQKVETLIHSLLPGQLELAYRDARFSIVIRLCNILLILALAGNGLGSHHIRPTALTGKVSVRMIYRHHRAKVGTVECTVDLCCLVTVVTSVRSIPVSVVVDGLQPHLQPIGDVRSQVQVDIETAVLIVIMFQCSPLVEETYRTVIGGLARTSVERQGVLLHQGVVFDGFIYPVGVAAIQILVGIGRIDEYRQIVFRVGIIGIDMIHIVLIVVIASTRVAVGQIMEIGKCPRIHILRFACRRIDRPVGRERDLGFLVFTFLGGNQHDTIGCLCSVNRSRSRILQYRYAFHIGRIDHVGIHLHAIDQYQGSGRVYRCSTTNVEPVSFARRTVVGGNVQVTDHTL